MPFKRHLAQPEDMITLLGSSPHWSPFKQGKGCLTELFYQSLSMAYMVVLWNCIFEDKSAIFMVFVIIQYILGL